MPVVLCGCETWSLTLKKIESRVMGKTYGLKKEGIIRKWKPLHNEELYDM